MGFLYSVMFSQTHHLKSFKFWALFADKYDMDDSDHQQSWTATEWTSLLVLSSQHEYHSSSHCSSTMTAPSPAEVLKSWRWPDSNPTESNLPNQSLDRWGLIPPTQHCYFSDFLSYCSSSGSLHFKQMDLLAFCIRYQLLCNKLSQSVVS